jgi:hypothetical protein
MMKTIKEYIEMYDLALSICNDKVLSLAVMQEMAKDSRMAHISEEKANRLEPKGEEATDKQLSYLERLGGQPFKGMTKQEASAEIERLKGLAKNPAWSKGLRKD